VGKVIFYFDEDKRVFPQTAGEMSDRFAIDVLSNFRDEGVLEVIQG